jgi:acid-sensing ion channel 5
VATSSYPTEWYAQVLTNNSNFNSVINTYFADANVPFINYTNRYADLKNAIARVHVFYEDLRVIEIDENPAMDIVALLGSLGGNLGLFLGASVLSFTELFIFLYDLTKQGLKVLYAKNQMRKLKRNKITGSVVDDPNYNSVAAIKIDRSLLA